MLKPHQRAAIIWTALSLVLLVIAACLTWEITKVEGHSPLFEQSRTWANHSQTLVIFAPNATAELARQVSVSYRNGREPDLAILTITFPPNVGFKFLMDHLQSAKSCSSPRSDQVSENDVTATVAIESGNSPLYLVVPKPDSVNKRLYVNCFLRSQITSLTFTKKTVQFYYKDSYPFFDLKKIGLSKADMLPGYRLFFGGMDGAYDFEFAGGFQESQLSNFEATRTLVPGQFVTAVWSDIFREQYRDILLVVIGTLIGIGVTTLIEGVRPFITGQKG